MRHKNLIHINMKVFNLGLKEDKSLDQTKLEAYLLKH